jgi:dephospho-CoA kinase
MARQLDPKHKAASADFVIWNNGSFQELEEQVKTIYSQLIK